MPRSGWSSRRNGVHAQPNASSVRPRVVVGGVWHETNTFSPIPTDLDAFRRFLFVEGDEIAPALGGTNTEIGGMLAAATQAGIEPIHACWAGAVPSGMVSRSALDDIIA